MGERYTKQKAKLVAAALEEMAKHSPYWGTKAILSRAAHLLRETARPTKRAVQGKA